MGFIKNLFGGGQKPPPRKRSESAKPARPPKRDTPEHAERPSKPADEPSEAAASGPSTSASGDIPSKQLIRQLGSRDAEARENAAIELARRGEYASVRPLINAYLNTGDEVVLQAMKAFGKKLTAAATHDAADPGVVGERRARLLDVLALTGDPEAAIAVRPHVDSTEALVHARACMALARLGDLHGVDNLSHDLERNDPGLRTLALDALRQLEMPEAKKAVADHVDRYLGNAGAVPDDIDISAPRILDPEVTLWKYLADHIARSPHALTVVVGPGAISLVQTHREDIAQALEGYELHFTTRQHPPEEQIEILEAARDKAVADADARVVVFGALPAPNDRPPLPHFLRKLGGSGYTAKIVIVEPHEANQVVSWWRYVDETRRIPTDFEVVLPVSTPKDSAISQEEYLVYQLTPADRRRDFLRAYIANL